MLQPPKSESKFTLTPSGTHIARLISIVQIGKIEVTWQGQVKNLEKIRLTFELVDELHVFEEGKDAIPFIISGEFTLSMGSKTNLRPLVEGMLGVALLDSEADAFDVEELLGKPCLLTVKHETKGDRTYANIASAVPLMKGQVARDAYNPITLLTYNNWSQDLFNKLPQFVKDKMMSSEQYKKKFGVKSEIATDEIPF